MLQGNFFKLDEEKTLMNKGIVIFRYLPIINKETKENPVYLSMNVHFISFNYHSYDEKEGIHKNIELFRLPLSYNFAIKDSLYYVLKDAYKTVYELDKNEEYIDYALDDKDDFRNISYWNLDAFGRLDESNEIIKKDEKLGYNRCIIFKKLILDFLFDWEHHQVFRNSPFYDEIEEKLRRNFFFNAIAAKAGYYYHRAQYVYDVHLYNDIDEKSAYDMVVKNLAEYEEQWLSIIRDPQAVKMFKNSGGWFNDVEKEYKIVFFISYDGFNHSKWQKEYLQLEREKERDYIELIKSSGIWFLRRYNIFSAVRIIINYKKKLHLLFYFLLVFSLLVVPYLIKIYTFRHNSDLFNGPHFLHFSVVIYVAFGVLLFLVLFSIFFWKLILVIINIIMPRMIMAIISAWFLFVTTEELVKVSFDIDLGKKIFWLFLLLVPVISFMVLELRNLAPDISKTRIVARTFVILIIAFVYSVIIGIFLTNFIMKNILIRSGYLETYYINLWENDDISKYLYTKTDTIKSLKIFYKEIEEKNVKTQFTNDEGGNKLSFIVSRCIDKELRKKGQQDKFFKLICEKVDKDYRLNEMTSIQDSLFNYLIFVKVKFLSKCKILYIVSLFGKKIIILPNMLFFRAIFSLFLGIFIQLIFEEKPVTEPI